MDADNDSHPRRPLVILETGSTNGKASRLKPLLRYSASVSSDALPPAAVVLMVSVRSVAKRSR